MSRGLSRRSIGRRTGGLVAVAVLGVTVAYILPATIVLNLGTSFPSVLSIEGFHDTEAGFRWSRDTSRVTFRDAGTTEQARVELELSGFRPPGAELPVVVLEAGSTRERVSTSRTFDLHTLDSEIKGWWSSDLELKLRSETFTPGAGDERSLGARVSRARLVLEDGARPPVRQLLFVALLVVLVSNAGSSERKSFIGAMVLVMAITVGYIWSRGIMTTLVPFVALLLLADAILVWRLPALSRFRRDTVLIARQDLARRAARMISARGGALLVLTGAAVSSSFWLTPHVELDLGSGKLTPLTNRFGALDRDADVTFRRAYPGATLDISDFGATGPWTVTVTASVDGDPATGVVVRADDVDLTSDVRDRWEDFTLDLPSRARGSAERALTFPGLGRGSALRVDRIVIDRGRSWPPLKVMLRVGGIALLLALASGSMAAGAIATVCLAVGLGLEPVVVLPFLPTLMFAGGATLAVVIAARGIAEAASTRRLIPQLAPAALSITAVGFFLWFSATASPRYEGGHYAFHTNIAKAISGGAFLQHFLPYPGSNLSRQPQWENLIVPHSCMFHTVVAPAAWLPGAWFHTVTKLALAGFCFLIAVTTALVATRLDGGIAGAYAAFACVFLPTSFQLLGLGHLMTLFGTLMATLALGFLAIHTDRIRERPIFVTAIALVTLCFVSYTGSLLFASLALAGAAFLTLRKSPAFTNRVVTIVIAGWVAAFALYYVYWAGPFVRETLPAMLSGEVSSESFDLWSRVRAQPGKLAYTFGSVWIPVLAVAGLWSWSVTKSASPERRGLIIGWAAILPGFVVLDVAFNFLLKHHYFAYPVVALGVALGLGRLHARGSIGKAFAVVIAIAIAFLGLSQALAVSQGIV